MQSVDTLHIGEPEELKQMKLREKRNKEVRHCVLFLVFTQNRLMQAEAD